MVMVTVNVHRGDLKNCTPERTAKYAAENAARFLDIPPSSLFWLFFLGVSMVGGQPGEPATSESRQLHPTGCVDASGGGPMSRIGCGKAVEEAAATKRGVWLAPVEGSVLAYSLALTTEKVKKCTTWWEMP